MRYYVMGAVGETGAPGNEWRTADRLAGEGDRHAATTCATAASSRRAARPRRSRSTTFLADPLHPTTIPGRGVPRREGRPRLREAGRGADLHDRRAGRAGRVDRQGAGGAVRLLDGEGHRLHRPRQRRLPRRPLDPADGLRPPGPLPRRATRRKCSWSRARSTRCTSTSAGRARSSTRGHRIRVTVASTGAPFYEPNPNTGEPLTIEFPKDAVVATNTVHHDRAHASRILAPVATAK